MSVEWDTAKTRQNAKKHRVTFERATTVFLDPSALSVFDEEHSEGEERWIYTWSRSHGGVAGYLPHLS